MFNLISSLKKCILFKNICCNEINILLSQINYKIDSFDKDQIIFSNHQTADTLGIVLSGSIHVQQIFPSGKNVIIATRDKHCLVGEPSIFSSCKHYPATVSACKSCKLLFIHRDELVKLFSMNTTIMKNYLESVSNSMIILKNKINILSFNSIKQRISYYLLQEYKHTNNKTITLPFSKKDWAEYMNVSRPSLSRELKKLELANIISFNNRNIIINDLHQLNSLLLD